VVLTCFGIRWIAHVVDDFSVSLQGGKFRTAKAILGMNDPKTIDGQDVAAQFSLSSSIRAIGGKFTANPLVGIVSRRVSMHTGLETFGLWQRHVLFRYAIPIVAVTGAVIATYSLGSTIKYTPNLFFCAVVLSSWLGGVGAGIFSMLLSVVALDYYFLPPIYALGLTLEETPDMVLFVAAGFFVNWVNRNANRVGKSLREALQERNSAFNGQNRERGKADGLLPVGLSSGELVDEKLDHEASAAKGTKKLCGVPKLTANKVEVEEELRRKPCTDGPCPDDRQVISLNGCRKPWRNHSTRLSGRDAVFCKHGDYWTIEFEGQVAWLKATRGLECVVCLLGQPGREFHVTELIGQVKPVNDLREQRPEKVGNQMRIVSLGSGDPILDAHAKTEYKLRLTELREELKEVDRFNDSDRVEKIQRELNAITEQLTAAVGLGGRNRRAASQAERARSAVTKRIRGSIQRIAKATPSLGHHLAVSIKTGYFCCYDPDPDCCVTWRL
jgi:hypothetical protein